jgi:hypothetical protein
MTSTAFDALTRGLHRQQAFSAPATAESGKRKKKKNNGRRDKRFARCTSQIPACVAFIQEDCGDNALCLAALTPCCDLLASCDFTAFATCFEDASKAP